MGQAELEAVIRKYEPVIAEALQQFLGTDLPASISIGKVEAFIRQGDLTGLLNYISAAYMGAAPPFLATLNQVVTAAGMAAADDITSAAARIERANRARYSANLRAGLTGMSALTGTTALPTATIPFPDDVPASVLFHGAEGFAYNPVNPKTVAATRTWQGNLIREMTLQAREAVMEQVREGILRGENPRTIATGIRDNISLTAYQTKNVGNFAKDIDEIVANGMRSAQTWGLYTPKQIAELKKTDPTAYKQLNFTARERREGRRWGKISRAAGTLQDGSKPIGFVDDPTTQGGANAYRIDAKGNPIDRMTKWRLRDKTLDPLIYDIVAAREAGDSAAEAKAKAKLKAKADHVKTRYHERYVNHRATTIARTETLRAANLGSYEGWRQAVEDSDLFNEDQVKRVWVTAKDDRVRMTHRAAAGQKTSMIEPFRVDGNAVMLPPSGPNCRCTVKYDVTLTP